MATAEPRVYVACLASYNAGRLHGRWIDLDGLEADEIGEAIDAMLAESPEGDDAEEWAIHDHEGLCGLLDGEAATPGELAEIAEAVDAVAEDADAFQAWCENLGSNSDTPSELLDGFRDEFQGIWDSEQDYAENFADDIGLLDSMPDNLRHYFDWESWSRDLFLGDYWSADVAGGVAVFLRS